MDTLVSRAWRSNLIRALVVRNEKSRGKRKRGPRLAPAYRAEKGSRVNSESDSGLAENDFFPPLSSLWAEADLQILCGPATEQGMVCTSTG